MTTRLTVTDHDRDVAGLTYVYPVVSRRAGGVSVGINLNPNNACNWRCVYCQVPDLVRGAAPVIDVVPTARPRNAAIRSARISEGRNGQLPSLSRVMRTGTLSVWLSSFAKSP